MGKGRGEGRDARRRWVILLFFLLLFHAADALGPLWLVLQQAVVCDIFLSGKCLSVLVVGVLGGKYYSNNTLSTRTF